MKNLSIGLLAVVFATLLLTGCETAKPQPIADNRPRFYENAQADVILKFNRWDTIHLLRPESREGGFLPILTRTDIDAELKTQRVNHDLAVVVLGFLFPLSLEAQYASEWDALLSAQGFKRVVVLRIGARRDTDGLLVVRDSAIAAAHDKPWTATPIAVLPAAFGAHVADPSGH